MRYKSLIYCLLLLVSTLLSCSKNESSSPEIFELKIPQGFPEMTFPSDNEFTVDRWILGKKLFYEKALSKNNSISCGSCHQQSLAFTDGLAKARGVEMRLGERNTPSLANVGYHPYLLREGSVSTLEKQILVPIQEHAEFDFSMPEIIDRLGTSTTYRELAHKAYSRDLDAFVLTRSIATFERSLISGNSEYDRIYTQGVLEPIDYKVALGKELFFSNKTNCRTCHSGFNFTNYSFQNNGLYLNYVDLGKQRATGKTEDLALFKVPSLRNIEYSAPYMHDGSINTLEEVVEHYNSGGKNHPQKSNLIQALGLTEEEKKHLVAFLKSLSDPNFLNDKNLSE
ncbi:MAG: cytochrome c peroxidase [Saprospiraceae bacterium]